MKRYLFISVFFSLILSYSMAQNVSVSLSDGSETNSSKVTKAEKNLTALLTQIDKAYQTNAKQVSFVGVQISEYAKSILNDALWSNVHFQLSKKEIKDYLWVFQKKMEVRHIPFALEKGKSNRDYQEAIIEFDLNGSILSFTFQDEQTLFEDLLSGSNIAEAKRQFIIWKWVERFRTAYNLKDTVFIKDMFADGAVIITGSVYYVQKRSDILNHSNIQDSYVVKYNKQTKDQYLRSLRRMMKRPDYELNVTFSAIENPNVTNDKIHYSKFITCREGKDSYYYGVRVRQEWNASHRGGSYSDTGFLFLLWEFPKDEKKSPMIHVRTWQPEVVKFDSIFSLTDFSDYLK